MSLGTTNKAAEGAGVVAADGELGSAAPILDGT